MLAIRMRICHVFNTIFFMYQLSYSKVWNSMLKTLIEKGKLVSVDYHTITIELDGKSYDIWIRNKWYSYGNLYALTRQGSTRKEYIPKECSYRPSVRTMIRLERFIRDWQQSNIDKISVEIYGEK